jgi:hypothetical protein
LILLKKTDFLVAHFVTSCGDWADDVDERSTTTNSRVSRSIGRDSISWVQISQNTANRES